MAAKEDRETRYFIDLDLKTRTILDWDRDQRKNLVGEKPLKPHHHRIYITRGQYNKLVDKNRKLAE